MVASLKLAQVQASSDHMAVAAIDRTCSQQETNEPWSHHTDVTVCY
jgi:hypothetical protein